MINESADWAPNVIEKIKFAEDCGRIGAIRDALQAIRSMQVEEQGRPFTLGICRTFTIEAQLDALTLALSTLPCKPTLIVGDLENIEQILLDKNSEMIKAKPDALLVLWRLEELSPRLVFEYEGLNSEEREQVTNGIIARILQLCISYGKVASAPLFLSTIPERFSFAMATTDVLALHGPRRAAQRINQAIQDLASEHEYIQVFDFSGWVTDTGKTFLDSKMDFYARQPIAQNSIMSLGNRMAKTIRPLLFPAKKVLAIDLDNVLWGGVLGEDGISGIKIGFDFPGNIYRCIQLHVLALKRRGTLLVLLSKNNFEDVEEAFNKLSDMPLKLTDFAAIRVNWVEKSKNIKCVAKELNLGLDSFVFVDDQGFEREQMRYGVPQVSILPVSEDPLQILNVLENNYFFDVLKISDLDRRKSEEYIAQAQREKQEINSNDRNEFLHSLELKANVSPVTNKTLSRAVQMLMKTNQFNVTTMRHNEADIRRMLEDDKNILITLSLSDKFGDQGIVGLAIALYDSDLNTSRVDSFLLSCRAIGRGGEQVLWAGLLNRMSEKKILHLIAQYIPTSKNRQVSDLFENLGMSKLKVNALGSTDYKLDLPFSALSPTWIEVENNF